jgi:radical SAM protein with 4Fe4S-binding SPASM domain
MALKQFLQNLFERVGLAETPMPPPSVADISPAEPLQLEPILLRLAAWGVKQVRFVVGDTPDADDLMHATRRATELGMEVGIRGRASNLTAGTLLSDLAIANVCDVELPLLSAVAEVHDALAGVGDYRCVLKALDALSQREVSVTALIVLTPSTWKTTSRTVELLEDRGVHAVRIWAVACCDDKPASWALSAAELVEAAGWLESHAPREMKVAWYPPLKFDPARTLAQQVRQGPRAAHDVVRIEADGSVIPPIGPATAGGNVSQNDWKLIARSEIFRAWKRRYDATTQCEQCPGLAACAGGCLRDEGNWAVD